MNFERVLWLSRLWDAITSGKWGLPQLQVISNDQQFFERKNVLSYCKQEAYLGLAHLNADGSTSKGAEQIPRRFLHSPPVNS